MAAAPLTAEEFGAALTALRHEARLSVRQVAARSGIPASTLGDYFAGRRLPPWNRPEVLRGILEACGVPAGEVPAWEQRLWEMRTRPAPPAARRAPWLGLESYGVEDADLFFGREQERAELGDAVLTALADRATVAVVGPSGAGKSSLLGAGLSDLGDDVDVRRITPGALPVDLLVDTLPPPAAHDQACVVVVDQLEELFTLGHDRVVQHRFLELLGRWLRHGDVSGPATGDDDGAAAPGRRAVVVGLRADHYGTAAEHPLLLRALRDRQVLVGPPGRTELHAVITGPARLVGLDLQDGLVDLILAEALGHGHASQVLPHLSHLLRSMWAESDRRELTRDHYDRVGGFRGSLVRWADAVVDALPDEDRRTARRLLLRLVGVQQGQAPSRRWAAREELQALGARAQDVLEHLSDRRLVVLEDDRASLSHEVLLVDWPLMDRWIRERSGALQVRDRVAARRADWVEAGRDPALLLTGSQLAVAEDWLAEHREDATPEEVDFVEASARREQDVAAGRERAHRRTRRLLAATTVLAVATAGLSVAAVSSRQEIQVQRDEARSRQVANLAVSLREEHPATAAQFAVSAHALRPTREAVVAVLDAAAGPHLTRHLDGAGVNRGDVAPDGSWVALGAADGSVRTAALTDDGLAEPSAPVNVLTEQTSPTTGVADLVVTPDGAAVVATAGPDGLRLVDVADPARPRDAGTLVVPAAGDPGYAVAVDVRPVGDGQLLVAGAGAQVLAWTRPAVDEDDPAGGWEEAEVVADHGRPVVDLAMAPDGLLAVTLGDDGTAVLWRVEEDAWERLDDVLVDPDGRLQHRVELSPDGATAAVVGRDKTLRLFAVGDGELEPEGEARAFASYVNDVEFAPDGEQLVAVGSAGEVHLWRRGPGGWDTTTWDVPAASVATAAPNVSVVALDDGRWFVAPENDEWFLWDTTGPVPVRHGDGVFTTRAAADGDLLLVAAGAGDGRLVLYDTTDDPRRPRQVSAVRAPEGEAFSGAADLGPAGTVMVGGTIADRVLAYDVRDPADPVTVLDDDLTGGRVEEADRKIVEMVAFDSAGSTLVAGGDNGWISWYDVDQERATVEPAGRADTGGLVYAVAHSVHDVAVVGQVGRTRLWSTRSGELLGDLETPGAVLGLDLDPADEHLVAVGAGREVTVWDVREPASPVLVDTLTGPGSEVYNVQYSSDGTRLAAASQDGRLWVWDRTDDGWADPLALDAAQTRLFAVGWGAGDEVLYAGGNLGEVRIWDTDVDRARSWICRTTGVPLTEQEWADRLPGVPWTVPCEEP
ncbi:helix-turn-helix domain-containing protein [uncultured Ornithinimicrobium sp.]|uniref:nSTAND1 domain-containing NTPase n=1 Tax=uncultured Ornithinimicrobium sp. TaxID=259307 RepID=UPI00259718D0|nr:helix-turn-helix domain-containing protein [uncultured Ornithinimicrobium sp.]